MPRLSAFAFAVAGVVGLAHGSDLRAQAGNVWAEGQWSVQAPAAGSCGSLPLLQVKGPGSILDGANAGVLSHLQAALPAALERVCPGAREAILVSGRSRKLIKVNAAEASTSQDVSVAGQSGTTQATPSPVPATADSARRPLPSGGPAPPPPAVNEATLPPPARSGVVPPRFPAPSNLASLANVRGTQGKCDVVLKWLESGKAAAATSRPGLALPPEMITIFSDPNMLAVFGTPYDQIDNSKRIELYEKLLGKCTGEARRPPPQRDTVIGGFHIHNPNGQEEPLPREYAQEFQPYRQVLDQAFKGQPGRFEPAAISRYVMETRGQTNWARTELEAAAAASASPEAFSRMDAARNAAKKEMASFSAKDRQAFTEYLDNREGELAPAIVQAWLREQGTEPKTLASARALGVSRRQLEPVYRRLTAADRPGLDDIFWRIADADIQDAVGAERAKLKGMPASFSGAQQLAQWETNFLTNFGEFRQAAAMGPAAQEFSQARERIYGAALPAWTKVVGSTPTDGAAIEARRVDLNTFFPDGGDRTGAVFTAWEAPLQAKQVQLQAKLAEDERRRQKEKSDAIARAEELQRKQLEANAIYRDGPDLAAARRGSGDSKVDDPKAAARAAMKNQPLYENSLVTLHLKNASTFAGIYTGDFTHVPMRRTELSFGSVLQDYMVEFNDQCSKHLPDNAVQMTVQECAVRTTQISGWGAGNSWCSSYRTVPTGRWADPEVYSASERLAGAQMVDTMKVLFNSINSSDPFGSAIRAGGSVAASSVEVEADTKSLIQMNGCTNPALARFQKNLVQYAEGGEPIKLTTATASR